MVRENVMKTCVVVVMMTMVLCAPAYAESPEVNFENVHKFLFGKKTTDQFKKWKQEAAKAEQRSPEFQAELDQHQAFLKYDARRTEILKQRDMDQRRLPFDTDSVTWDAITLKAQQDIDALGPVPGGLPK
jgi:hypothetical protein